MDRPAPSFPQAPIAALALLLLLGSTMLACHSQDPSSDGGETSAEAWWGNLSAPNLGEIGPEDLFWAALPRGAGAEIVLLRSPDGGGTWVDALERPVETHRGLIHAFGPGGEGDIAWTVIPGDGAAVGQRSAEGAIRVDWNGATRELKGLPTAAPASAPWRIYSADDVDRRALEIGRGDGKVWLLDAGGHVVNVPEDAAKAQAFRNDWAVEEAVSAFTWADGFRPGKIVEEIEPGLRFRVRLDDGAERLFFFDDLAGLQ